MCLRFYASSKRHRLLSQVVLNSRRAVGPPGAWSGRIQRRTEPCHFAWQPSFQKQHRSFCRKLVYGREVWRLAGEERNPVSETAILVEIDRARGKTSSAVRWR